MSVSPARSYLDATLNKPLTVRFTPATKAVVSHGLMLFNKEGKLLVIRRAHSYGFSSFVSLILGTETTEIPLAIACERLLTEVTPDELTIVRENWSEVGLEPIMKKVLDMMTDYSYLQITKRYFQRNFEEYRKPITERWKSILKTVNISKIKPGDQARIHDFPKGRGNGQFCLKRVIYSAHAEAGLHLKDNVTYKGWYSVSYTASNNICYRLSLVGAVCSDLTLSRPYLSWISLGDLKVLPEIATIVTSAKKRCFQ